jgi:hypothetical protein
VLRSSRFPTVDSPAFMELPSKREILLVGIGVVSAGLVQMIHSLQHHPKTVTFETRLCCKNLAAAYARNPRDGGEMVVEHIEFSPARNSCLASTFTLAGRHHEVEKFGVVDVVSEERIFESFCNSVDPKAKVFCRKRNGHDHTETAGCCLSKCA